MNETNVRNEILDSIDQVNTVTMESTIDVFNSLAASYDKAGMILEYSNASEDELGMFAIFQEAEAKEGDAKSNGGKQESLGMKILMFIPNILKKIWQFLKDAWNGIVTPKAPTKENKSLFEKILGKDAEWINNHKVELGLSGAALASVIAFVTFMKKDAIANALSRWFGNIKKFFLAIKVAPKLAFNGKSFVTNIKLKGFVGTLKDLIGAVKAAQDAIKFIEDNAPNKNFSAIKDTLANWIKNVENIKKAAESDPFILGEDIDLTGASLVEILNTMKKLFTEGLPATAYDVNVEKLKALFENGEDSYVKEILGQLNNMKTALGLIGGIVMSSSELMKDANAYATVVFDVQNKADGSAPAEGGEGEAKEEEKPAEEGEESGEASEEEAAPLIENKEVDAAVTAVQEEPTDENAEKAIDTIEKAIDAIPTESDPKKIQVVTDMKKGAEQVRTFVKKNKADKRAAKKIARMARAAEKAGKVVAKKDADPKELAKAEHEFRTAVRQGSIGTEKTLPSGEKMTRETQAQTYTFAKDSELLNFLNEKLGKGNNIQSVDKKAKLIKLTNGKPVQARKGYTMAKTAFADKLALKHGRIRLSNNGNAWIVEFCEDDFDKFNMILESAIDTFLGYENEDIVVEYADGETEEGTELVLESYDEVSAEAAAEEKINNHWYR